MARHRAQVLALGALLSLASPAAAGVWTVAPSCGDFTQIFAAVAAAQDGDLILVEPSPSPYGSFTVDGKSVVISIRESGAPAAVLASTIQNLAAGQSCVLRGFVVTAPTPAGATALTVTGCAGAVRLEDCSFTGNSSLALGVGGGRGVFAFASADVGLTHCVLNGGAGASSFTNDWDASSGGPGLSADVSTVWVHDCQLDGGDGGSHFDPDIIEGDNYEVGDGAAGARLQDSTVTVAGSLLTGGTGGVQIISASKSLGGPGVIAFGNSLYRERDNVYVPGTGTQEHVVTPEIQADPTHVLSVHVETRELQADSPHVEGETIHSLLIGDSGDLNILVASPSAQGQWHFGLAGPLLVDPVGMSLFVVGVTPASGELSLSATVPPLPALVEHLELHLQLAVAHDGEVTLENGSVVVLLDSSF